MPLFSSCLTIDSLQNSCF